MNELHRNHLRWSCRNFLWLLAAHLPLYLSAAWHFKTSYSTAAIGWAALLAGPLIAYLVAPASRITAVAMGIAAMCFSGLLIHLGRGMIEMHFHVFAMLAILAGFASPAVLIAAAVAIALHHLAFFLFLPASVFNYHASLGIVFLHAAFVIFQTIPACIVARRIRMFVQSRGVRAEVAHRLATVAEQVDDASRELTHSSASLARGAEEQAASLEAGASAISAAAQTTDQTSANAEKARQLALHPYEAAQVGAADMHEMEAAVSAIKTAGDNIAKIVKSIDELAFQTNILALNAAVEAARAGEAGAGFAVVAEEVRALAHRSASASRETSDRIGDSIDKSRLGVELSQRVAARLADILGKARELGELATASARAAKNQTTTVRNVNSAVSRIGQATRTNASTAKQSAAAARNLQAQSTDLRELIAALQDSSSVSGPTTTRPVAMCQSGSAPPVDPPDMKEDSNLHGKREGRSAPVEVASI